MGRLEMQLSLPLKCLLKGEESSKEIKELKRQSLESSLPDLRELPFFERVVLLAPPLSILLKSCFTCYARVVRLLWRKGIQQFSNLNLFSIIVFHP